MGKKKNSFIVLAFIVIVRHIKKNKEFYNALTVYLVEDVKSFVRWVKYNWPTRKDIMSRAYWKKLDHEIWN